MYKLYSLLFVLVIYCSFCFSQSDNSSIQSNFNKIYPMENHIAEVKIPLGKRNQFRHLHIHPCDPVVEENLNKKVFYVKPAFTLVPSRETIVFEGIKCPNIIHYVDEGVNSKGNLEIGIMLQTFSENAFLQSCRNAIYSSGVKEDFEVRKWPLTHLITMVYRRKEFLGIGETGSLIGTGNEIEVVLEMNKQKFLKLLKYQRSISLEMRYTFMHEKTYKGSIKFNATSSLKVSCANSFSSEQLEESALIKQTEYRQFFEELQSEVITEIRAEHKDILVTLGNEIKFMTAEAFKIHKNFLITSLTNKQIQQVKLADYLKQIVNSVTQNITRQNHNIKDKKFNRQEKIGIGFSYKGFQIGISEKKKIIEKVKNISGVTLKDSYSTSMFLPHMIDFYQLKEGWQNKSYSAQKFIYLNADYSNGYYKSMRLPLSYTSLQLEHLKAPVTRQENKITKLEREVQNLKYRLETYIARVEKDSKQPVKLVFYKNVQNIRNIYAFKTVLANNNEVEISAKKLLLINPRLRNHFESFGNKIIMKKQNLSKYNRHNAPPHPKFSGLPNFDLIGKFINKLKKYELQVRYNGLSVYFTYYFRG